MTPTTPRGRASGRDRASLVILSIVAAVPLLLTAPGYVVADTKSYLYLDPQRVLERAPSMWDHHVGLGTVTHQNIGYLWPMGPYYWVLDRVGVPDWLAQRLWLSIIVLAAGAGVRFLLRTFGWSGAGVTVAAVTYALTPYLLTLAARISVILLAFAGLPWLLAFTIRSLRRSGWRDPALFALTVVTIGSVNATALVLVGLAPLLWVPFAVWVSHEVRPRTAMAALARIGVLTVAVNLWWIAGLSVQASHGIDVLRFTETAEVVAGASLAHEVLRGLGYWFFYGGDRLGPWIEASHQYTQRLGLLVATYAMPALGLLGAGIGRWRHRAYFVGLLLAGTAIAVGAYPWDDPPLFGRAVKWFLLSPRGLAMRSLPRAVPLVALALAVLLGSGVIAVTRRRPSLARPLTIALVVLAVIGLPTVWFRQVVPENLRRKEDVPEYWQAAATQLGLGDNGTRVLELPGSDFASYRWGDTVDPITTGLTDRPVAARELIPYGTPPSANLLIALDEPYQEHVADPAALAPVARLLRAGDVLIRSDLQYERFNTPRPRELWDLMKRTPGFGQPIAFGARVPNIADPIAPLIDELELGADPALPDPPPVAVFPVQGPREIVDTKSAAAPVIVAGDGAGIVDASGAGLLDGSEPVLYAASLTASQLHQALDDGAALVVTDSNRRRGERWTTVRFTRGYTEPAGLRPMRRDLTDNRLVVFEGAGDDARTVAVHEGGISANATSYGNPITFSPEERPALAVDGDVTTAWRTSAFAPIRGERLRLTLDEPVTTDHITLVQPTTGEINRWITKVRLRFDGSRTFDADLGLESREPPGQQLTFSERSFTTLEIEVLDDTGGERPRYGGLSSAGFAEVQIGEGGPVLDELVRPPVNLLVRAGEASLDRPLAFVLTRLRSAPTETTRNDEELAIARLLDVPVARSYRLAADVRLSPRASDDVLDALVGIPAEASGGITALSSARLQGDRTARASAAIDGDTETAWSHEFGQQEGAWIDIRSARPFRTKQLDLAVIADGRHSVPTALTIDVDGERAATVQVPAIRDAGSPRATRRVTIALPRELRGRRLRVTVDAVRAVRTINWYGGRPITMPVAIAELGVNGLRAPTPRDTVDSGCRRDLLMIGDEAVGVRVTGSTADALAGLPLALRTCRGGGVRIAEGGTTLRTAQGRSTGLDVDRVVLRSAAGGRPSRTREPIRVEALSTAPAELAGASTIDGARSIDLIEHESGRVEARITGATRGTPFWLVLGESYSDGWTATVDGATVDQPTLVDGFANGWRITPTSSTIDVQLRFDPQRRVDVALVISGLAALVCIVLALTGASRRLPSARPDELPLALSPFLVRNYDGRLPSVRRAIGTALLLGAGGWALVNPVVGLLLAVASYRALRDDRMRRWFVVGAPAMLVAAAGYVVVWQIRYDIPPGFEWPGEFSRAHPLAWLAVLVLVADTVIDRIWSVPHDAH